MRIFFLSKANGDMPFSVVTSTLTIQKLESQYQQGLTAINKSPFLAFYAKIYLRMLFTGIDNNHT